MHFFLKELSFVESSCPTICTATNYLLLDSFFFLKLTKKSVVFIIFFQLINICLIAMALFELIESAVYHSQNEMTNLLSLKIVLLAYYYLLVYSL